MEGRSASLFQPPRADWIGLVCAMQGLILPACAHTTGCSAVWLTGITST